VAAFTGGIAVPSARFRVRQYVPRLQSQGVIVDEMHSPFGQYPPKQIWQRPFWGLAALAGMVPLVARSHSYDVVLLQREMLSTFFTLESLTKSPRVLDVDDAIFLHRGGGFARRLAKVSDRVICGNEYLANWFGDWNSDVTIIPTAIDTSRYLPAGEGARSAKRIGWIGTAGNLQYLRAIDVPLAKVMAVVPDSRLLVVCDEAPVFEAVPGDRVDFVKWSEDIEIDAIQSMDVGIMPLADSAWARGKCSYKMLQYMSCQVPVVASPVGMNAEVFSLGNFGIPATSAAQWGDGLVEILRNDTLAKDMGIHGRQVVEQHFSLQVLARRLAGALRFN